MYRSGFPLGQAVLTEHAGLLGVDVTDGGLLVAVVRETETRSRPIALQGSQRLGGHMSIRAGDLQAVELELVVLGGLDGAVLGERADDGHGLVELGFDRHDC